MKLRSSAWLPLRAAILAAGVLGPVVPARSQAPDPTPEMVDAASLLTPAQIAGFEPVNEAAIASVMPSVRRGHSVIVDPIRQRLVVFGGEGPLSYMNDVWTLPLNGPPIWTQLNIYGTLPTPRVGHAAIYDPVRDRMVVVGGYGTIGSLQEIWTLNLYGTPQWSRIIPSGTPPASVYLATTIYDPVRDRIVGFGGISSGVYFNDAWTLSLSVPATWGRIDPPGPRAGGRIEHAAIYDAARDRMIVSGGTWADIWALPFAPGAAWEKLAASGSVPAVYSHVAVCDSASDRMVVLGNGNFWSFPLGGGAWSPINPATPPPANRWDAAVAVDAAHQRMVIFGGVGPYSYLNDTWLFPLRGQTAWSQILPIDPPAPTAPIPVFADSITGIPTSIYLGQSFTLGAVVRNEGVASDDGRIVVSFPALTGGTDGDRVSSTTAEDAPGFRTRAAGAPIEGSACQTLAAPYLVAEYVDAAWDGFEGQTRRFDLTIRPRATGTFYIDVRSTMHPAGSVACNAVNGLPANGASGTVDPLGWPVKRFAVTVKALPAPGAAPVRRRQHTAVRDSLRNRMIVYGGWDGAPSYDVWALSLGANPSWSLILPDQSPIARYGHSTIYDPIRDRLLVFGGYDNARRNDVWALSLSGTPTWTQLFPTGNPPQVRRYHTAIYDPVRDRMIVHGGAGETVDLNDVWALELAGTPRWVSLGGGPRRNKQHAAVYDPVRDRMLTFGGTLADGTLYNEVWAMWLNGNGWTDLSPASGRPPGRSGSTLTYDRTRDLLWMIGGNTGTWQNDAWTFSLTQRVWEDMATWGGPLPVREMHTAIADPERDRLVVYGGTDSLGRLGDTWFLTGFTPPVWQKLGAAPTPPAPTVPAPVVASVSAPPASITIGQTFTVTVSARNDGGTSDDGRIALSFPSFTSAGDGQWVQIGNGGDAPGGLERVAGTTITSAACAPMTASYLVAEYADSSWQGFGHETNAATFTVQPRATGTFEFYVRAGMHRVGGTACDIVGAVPSDGAGGYTDQQGWPVKRYTVQVNPPTVPVGPGFVNAGIPYPDAITLGQTITLTIRVRNVGAASDDGQIVVGFPSFTAAGDSQYVAYSPTTIPPDDDLPGFRELPVGTTLLDSLCTPVSAPYLTVAYQDNDWRMSSTEENELRLVVTPNQPGNFYIDVRTTLRTAGLPGCPYFNGYPQTGNTATDPQGWTVRRYTVQVAPPPTVPGPVYMNNVVPSVSAVVLGDEVRLSVRVKNLGAASNDGRIVVEFPALTDAADVALVNGYAWGGVTQPRYREWSPGSAVSDSACRPMTSSHVVVEAADTSWAWLGEETNNLDVYIRPRAIGPFPIVVRTTLRTLGVPCGYVNVPPPLYGSTGVDSVGVDEQGWTARYYMVTVTPAPPPDPTFSVVTTYPSLTLPVGQTLAISVSLGNASSTSPDGRISVSFPDYTAVTDTQWVTLASTTGSVDTPGYRKYAAGSTLTGADCQPMTTSYLAIEYADDQWAGYGGETNGIVLNVIPQTVGTLTFQVRGIMNVLEGTPCVYVNRVPPNGSAGVDQQGWPVSVFTVNVTPPPPTEPAFLGPVAGIPTYLDLGDSITIRATVRNFGTASDDGRVSIAFPTLTGAGDAQWVRTPVRDDLPGYELHPAGSILATAACGTVAAPYLVSEYRDGAWLVGETNLIAMTVRPPSQGTFYVDVRATMHDSTAAAGPCAYPDATPYNSAVTITDPQGWTVRRFTVIVGPPPGPPSTIWLPLVSSTPGPTPRIAATGIYHPRRDALIIYGGIDLHYHADVWSLPMTQPGGWTEILPGGPNPQRRFMHSMIYNTRDDQLVIFGGFYDRYLDDMTVMAFGPIPWWFPNPGYGTPPSARGGHAAVYDSLRNRMLLIGGFDETLHNDVWEYTPPGTGTWSELAVGGTAMSPRAQHAAVYDPVRDRVIVIGGDTGVFMNDVWALDLAGPLEWHELSPTGVAPSPRREHTAIYDPAGDRIIVFGGFDGQAKNDIWELSLGETPVWKRLTAIGTSPTPRYGHTAVFDPLRRRMVVFGGGTGPGTFAGDVFALGLDIATPVAVALANADATPDRVRLAWTIDAAGSVEATVSRSVEGSGQWIELGNPIRSGERLEFEDQTIMPGTRYGYRLVVWEGGEETRAEPVWVTVPERAVLALRGVWPNPASRDLSVVFTLPGDQPALLELYDLGGRRIASREVGTLGAGEHRVGLADARSLPAGIYLVRLRHDRGVLTAKACVVR
ncbi:MAG TPA: kelch repeat-containing protein [Candidatus Eisenbacteria bacterium]|nr:kelch repeat-containing protein [Candidatus Eisenbacteria bacterium]